MVIKNPRKKSSKIKYTYNSYIKIFQLSVKWLFLINHETYLYISGRRQSEKLTHLTQKKLGGIILGRRS